MNSKLFSSLRKCLLRSQCLVVVSGLIPIALRAANSPEPRAMSAEEKRQERLLGSRQIDAREKLEVKMSAFQRSPSTLERFLQQASVFDPQVSATTEELLRLMGRDPARSSLGGKAEVSRLWVSYVLKKSRDQASQSTRDLEALPGYRANAESELLKRTQNLQEFPPDGALNWSLLSALGKAPESLSNAGWRDAAQIMTDSFSKREESRRAGYTGGSSGGGAGGGGGGPAGSSNSNVNVGDASLSGPTILDPNLTAPSSESPGRNLFKKMALAKKEESFVSEQSVARKANLDKMDFDIPLEEVVTDDGKVKFLIPAKPDEEGRLVSEPLNKKCVNGNCLGDEAKTASASAGSSGGAFTWSLPPIDLSGASNGGGSSGGAILSSSGELLGGAKGSSGASSGSLRGGSQSTIPATRGGEHSSGGPATGGSTTTGAPVLSSASGSVVPPLPTATGARQPASLTATQAKTPAVAPSTPKPAPAVKPVVAAAPSQPKGSLDHLINRSSEGLTDLGAKRLQGDFEQVIQSSISPPPSTPVTTRTAAMPALSPQAALEPAKPQGALFSSTPLPPAPSLVSASGASSLGASGGPAIEIRRAEPSPEIVRWVQSYQSKHGKAPSAQDFRDLVNNKDKSASPAVVTAAQNYTAQKLEGECADALKTTSKADLKKKLKEGFERSMQTASKDLGAERSIAALAASPLAEGQGLTNQQGNGMGHTLTSPSYDHSRSLYFSNSSQVQEAPIASRLVDISLLLRGVTSIKNPACLYNVEALKSGGFYEADNRCTSFGTSVDKIPSLSKEVTGGGMRLAALFYLIESTAKVHEANYPNTQRLIYNLMTEKNLNRPSNEPARRLISVDVHNSLTKNFDRGSCRRGNQWAGVVRDLELGLRQAAVDCKVYEAITIAKNESKIEFQTCMDTGACADVTSRNKFEAKLSTFGRADDPSIQLRSEPISADAMASVNGIPAAYRDLLGDNTPQNKIDCKVLRRHYLFFAAMNFNLFSTVGDIPPNLRGSASTHQGVR